MLAACTRVIFPRLRGPMRFLALVTSLVALLPTAAYALRPPVALTRRQCTSAAVAAAAATALPHCAGARGTSLTDADGRFVVDPQKAANRLEDPLADSDGAYSTISAALAVAPSGAAIIVRAGTYAERLTLTRPVRLLADRGAVLAWTSKGPNEPALTVDLSGATGPCEVLVSGLTVRHATLRVKAATRWGRRLQPQVTRRWAPVSRHASPYFALNYAVYVPRPAAVADAGSRIELRGCEVRRLQHLGRQPETPRAAASTTYGCSLHHLRLQPPSPTVAACITHGCR